MKCDACAFFDCGKDCRCKCHERKDYPPPRPKPYERVPKLKTWDSRKNDSEEQAMSGLSALFG